MSDGLLELREIHGPYGNLWAEYLRATPDQPKLDYIPDWFLIQLVQDRLDAAGERLTELMPPPRLPAEDGDLDTRVEFAAVPGALLRLRQFIDYGEQADPVDARRRVLSMLLGGTV
jgi:hypothetical protein